MKTIQIHTEYIKLDQFLKYAGIVDTGSDAKILINEEQIRVNGEVAFQRGKKIRHGDKVEIEGQESFLIEGMESN